MLSVLELVTPEETPSPSPLIPPPHLPGPPRASFPSVDEPVLDVSRTWTHTSRGLSCLVPSLSVVRSGSVRGAAGVGASLLLAAEGRARARRTHLGNGCVRHGHGHLRTCTCTVDTRCVNHSRPTLGPSALGLLLSRGAEGEWWTRARRLSPGLTPP